jgi:hypothetical protein
MSRAMSRARTLSLLIFLCAGSLFISTSVSGQVSAVQPRITRAWDESRLTVLKGNVHPLARAQFDRGPAPLDLPMQRMLLVLKRSAEQETALRKLLDDQQDKASPSFHKWLTPEEFGQQFGPADQDIQTIKAWLQGHGFQVAKVARGRSVIEFSGQAGQVQEAFHTAIHKFTVGGEDHWANANEPQIPAALTPVVAGVHTLHNFLKKPQVQISPESLTAQLLPGGPGKAPQLTFPGSPATHALDPWDFNTLYNVPYTDTNFGGGIGSSIAVVARSDFDYNDLAQFWALFGPASGYQTYNEGPDPGNLGGGEEVEALLDATWATSISQGAVVTSVVSASTNTTDGVDLSEEYIIDNDLADIMTESFGSCEAVQTSSGADDAAAWAEQAAAEGITYVVSSGDTGAEGCDPNAATVATGPVSVNVLASTPYTVAVGGTLLNENGQDSKYWNSTNMQGSTFSSALSYIPEGAWNESCTAAQCGQNANIQAGGGGASIFFAKPAWQSGVAGIPNDQARDVPDVSLTAASHDPYLLCLHGSCQIVNNQFQIYTVFGTSAAAPAFAAILSRVPEALMIASGQPLQPKLGQVNYVLYRLAAQETFSQCNGSNTAAPPASTCVFNDVTKGNNAVPGEIGTKYAAGTGYDLATGLGSVNVSNLFKAWSAASFHPTTTTLVVNSGNPVSVTHGSAVAVNANVTSSSGTPSGDIGIVAAVGNFNGSGYTPNTPVSRLTLSGGGASASTNLLPGGTYNVSAHYEGDGTYAPSDSAGVMVTVNPEASMITESALTADQNGHPIPFTGGPYGTFIYLRADVSSASGFGTATGSVNFTDPLDVVPGYYTLNSQGNTATSNGLFTLTPGAHAVRAVYSGDSSLTGSTSAPVNFTITQAATTTTATVTSNPQGTGAIFTATVASGSYGNPPSGTMTFVSGSTQLASAPVSGGVNSSNNTAMASVNLTDTQLADGQYNVVATFSGDTNYAGSSAIPIGLNLQPDFALSLSANTLNVSAPGGSAFALLTVTALDGFNGAFSFAPASCSGLPAQSSCKFSVASFNGSGTTQVAISTTGPTQTAQSGGTGTRPSWHWTNGLALLVAGIFLAGVPARKSGRKVRLMGLLLPLLLLLPSCGGGSGGGGGGHITNPGTPAGTYAVTVTVASGSLSHTATFQLNVQ